MCDSHQLASFILFAVVTCGMCVPGFLEDGFVAKERPMPIALVLQHRMPGSLAEIAMHVSNPKHAKYGHHLSNADLEHFAADPTAKAAVEAWVLPLIKPGAFHWGVGGDIAFLDTSAEEVRKLFPTDVLSDVKFSGATVPRKVPKAVSPYVIAVFGTSGNGKDPTNLRQINANKHGCSMLSDNRTGCFNVTPSVITGLYNISGVKASPSAHLRQAVLAIPWGGEDNFPFSKYGSVALANFFEQFVDSEYRHYDHISGFFPNENISQPVYGETMLDTEYIMGLAPGVPTDLHIYNSGNITQWCHTMLVWTNTLLSTMPLPQVISISYGFQGNMTMKGYVECGHDQQEAVDVAFMKLAARGVSILVSSGDNGAGNNGAGVVTTLFPSWPASSRWVTAVGATRVSKEGNVTIEAATNTFGSGGGFSWDLDAPDWQKEAVAGYFKSVNASSLPPVDCPTGAGPGGCLPGTKLYRPGGRATPDVAALGEGYQIIGLAGEISTIEGTSAATPTFAAMVSLLNQARIARGCSPLGFLNPFLYQHPEALTDITIGTGRVAYGGRKAPQYGWDCAKGWDPVTGLGTPKFPALLKLVSDCVPIPLQISSQTNAASVIV